MRSLKCLFLIGLLSAAFVTVVRAEDPADDVEDDEYADTDTEHAHLIVHKFISQDIAVQGRNLTVTVQIYNAGLSGASSVQLKDSQLPPELELIEGELSANFDMLTIGANVTHSYVVVPKSGDKAITLEPATVTYRPAMDSDDKQVGYSTSAKVYVMTPVQQIQRHALNVGSYLTLGMARTPTDWRNLAILLTVLGSLFGANYAVKQVSDARVQHRRKKALESLEKDE